MSSEPLPVVVGQLAPDFTLPAIDGESITLSSYRDRCCLILVFLRGFF